MAQAHQDFGWSRLFRIESERRELPAPFGRRIAEQLDADAPRQAAFYGSFYKLGSEEGERDRRVHLPNAALFASADLLDCGHSTKDYIIEPQAALWRWRWPGARGVRTAPAGRCFGLRCAAAGCVGIFWMAVSAKGL
jgi:hypothetical protein